MVVQMFEIGFRTGDMNSKREKEFAGPPGECAACEVKIGPHHKTTTREYLSEVYLFCSEKCAKDFSKDPESFDSTSDDNEEE